MAIYHFHVKAITRSKGQSCLSAAAYRAGCVLKDVSKLLTHDYRYKKDVVFSRIYTPVGAPDWAHDRQSLWSAVVGATKRRDGQEAREFELALPRELSPLQQRELVDEYAGVLTELGMVVDANIHGGRRNPHTHLLAPVRDISLTGFGKVNRAWGKALVLSLRQTWEDLVNQRLSRAGLSARVCCRSLAAQGIKRIPSRHLGPKVAAMARKGNLWAIQLSRHKQRRANDLPEIRETYYQQTIQALRGHPDGTRSEQPFGPGFTPAAAAQADPGRGGLAHPAGLGRHRR